MKQSVATETPRVEHEERHPGTPIPEPSRAMIDRVGGGDFWEVGDKIVRDLVRDAGLSPEMRVLDIGCGCGRAATALTKFLSPMGIYEGFDVIPELVEWCQQEITPRYPQFHFQVADLYNGEYRPDLSTPAARYRFPYADASFDFAFLISVFTHMLPDDVYHYLAEIARVLKPGGTVYASYFLLDEESRWAVLNNQARLAFTDAKDGYATIPGLSDEYATALFASTVRLTHEMVGLRIRDTQRGPWRQNIGQWIGQDVLIAERM